MSLDKVKVSVGDLKKGMFVADLDRPWLDTPFPFQGFIVTHEDIPRLAQYCRAVYIDVEKSEEAERPSLGSLEKVKPSSDVLFDKKRQIVYQRTASRDDELKVAKHTYDGMQNAYDKLIVDVATNKKINIPQLKQAIVPMVDSVIRNPDALILLTRLKSIDAYAYLHAMSCAVLAVAMGRHIGLPKTMLQELALGAALFDIGRARINHELLTRPRRLSDDEMVEVRKHVDYAVEMVKRNGHISASAVHMIETHHERHDGSGYPEGLKGEEIPLFGRIAGIVDCYDAITTTRPHAKPVSPDEAIRLLYQWRDIDFQGAIIEQFIQVIGIYPVGTIVQLSDGRVGIVVAQHLEARLRPVVMVLMESDKQLLDDYYEFDMRKHTSGHNGQALSISHSLSPGSYGIDPAEYFI